MFKCESCGKQTKPLEPMHRVVTQKRTKEYDNGGVGWEIVKEIGVCTDCAPKKD